MSRNGSGTMTVVNTMVPGTTITASDHNENYVDIAAEITNSVAADGQSTMTGALKAASGTAALPGLAFGSDTDTGVYRIGANNLGVAVAGAKVLDVAATGLDVTGTINSSGAVKQAGFALLPAGLILPYGGSAAPSGFLLCYGQSLLRASYPDLFTAIGTTYGAADGTHFSLPDIRGRVIAGADAMGGVAASRLTSTISGGATNGNSGGTEVITLAASQIPSITSANASQSITVTGPNGHTVSSDQTASSNNAAGGGNSYFTGGVLSSLLSFSGTNSISVTSNNTGGGAHINVQPTLILNYIIFAGV